LIPKLEEDEQLFKSSVKVDGLMLELYRNFDRGGSNPIGLPPDVSTGLMAFLVPRESSLHSNSHAVVR
jgi:hypothetical protein